MTLSHNERMRTRMADRETRRDYLGMPSNPMLGFEAENLPLGF